MSNTLRRTVPRHGQPLCAGGLQVPVPTAAEALAISGKTGPIERHTQILETSARISAVFAQTTNGESIAEQLPDDGLRAVQAVNFLQAQREAQASGGALPLPKPTNGTAKPVAAPAPPEPDPAPVPAEPTEPEPPPVHHTLAFIESDLSILCQPPDRDGLPPIYELKRRGQLMRRAAWNVVLELAKKQSGGSLGAFVVQEPRPTPELGAHVNSREQLGVSGDQLPSVHRGWANRKRR